MSWISRIAEKVNNSIDSVVSPAPTLPPLLLLCEIMNRPGMSSIRISSNAIAKLTSINVDNGKNKDGGDNVLAGFIKIVGEEFVKEWLLYSKVTMESSSMSMPISSESNNENSGVPFTATNDSIIKTDGISR